MRGQANLAFNDDTLPANGGSYKMQIREIPTNGKIQIPPDPIKEPIATKAKRETWSNDWEFLMSCISLSVGLGNVWRFPFTALENGGGAFIIPYLIVLVLVGKPVYYLEMLMGQFSSRSSVQVFDFSPAMRGIGVGQVLSTALVTSYYASLLALTIRYFIASFNSLLPWSECKEEWGNVTCIDSSAKRMMENMSETRSISERIKTSAELYFYKDVLKETESIHEGIGLPDWKLVICLGFAWICITLILIKGIRSSGKASYFLAIFPYVIMGVLLVRSVTLPGAGDGILYFITPQFDQLLNPKVWYAAVSQVFFSLAICFGNIIMYSSFNRFSQNVYRDTLIVTTLDTCTSLVAGVIIFGILGNLAYETGTSDITSVVQGGTGVAFVSYPDAIAKFELVPQVFAAVFFFMLFVLGIGTNVGMSSCLMTTIKDRFTQFSHWKVASAIAIVQFSIGLLYLTPGGQYMLQFVDYFGASFVAFFLAIAELIAFGWIYGVSRICRDIEFMLGIKTGWYWRICWGIVTPGLMIAIIIYNLATLEPLKYNNYVYPDVMYTIGWCISTFGILQLPIWGCYAVFTQSGKNFVQKFIEAFKPSVDWGPSDPDTYKRYREYVSDYERELSLGPKKSIWKKMKDNIFA